MPTSERLEEDLERWLTANVIDLSTANRIRDYEGSHESTGRSRWLIVVAIIFGALMLAAGVLLFVAAHWDELSPMQRMLLVLFTITALHLSGGILHSRMKSLSAALHGVGTVALGGGIFLAGQIFNLQEHWPGGILLWSIGAVLGWLVLRDPVQATLAALLCPFWLASEISVRFEHVHGTQATLARYALMIAFAYLSALPVEYKSYFRRALVVIGSILLLPVAAAVPLMRYEFHWRESRDLSTPIAILFALVAFGVPLLTAWLLRGRAARWVVGFALWTFVLACFDSHDKVEEMGLYCWFGIGAIGLVWWGLREHRRERINLGVTGFALTVIAFYFSAVMDKLGRSAALIGFGMLFLFGGWSLEKVRRKLVRHADGGAR